MQTRNHPDRLLRVTAFALLFGTGVACAQSAPAAAPAFSAAPAGAAAASTGRSAPPEAMADAAPGATSKSGAPDTAAAATTPTAATAATAPATQTKLSRADRNLMRDMAYANLAEIATANLALKQSQSEQVKSFAQKMIDDHTQAHKELEQLAQAKGVTLPTEPDRKQQAAMKKLQQLQGERFDRQYLAQGGVRDHRDTHRMLTNAQRRATDPDLKALVAKTAPIVDDHLKTAQDAHGGAGTASGASGTAGTAGAGK